MTATHETKLASALFSGAILADTSMPLDSDLGNDFITYGPGIIRLPKGRFHSNQRQKRKDRRKAFAAGLRTAFSRQ